MEILRLHTTVFRMEGEEKVTWLKQRYRLLI
jgi:hypothetical protein